MALSWVVEIFDKVSAPGKDMAEALTKVEKELHAVEEKVFAADQALAKSKIAKMTDPLQKQAAELRLQRDALAHLAAQHRELGEAQRASTEHAGGFFHKLKEGLEFVYFGKEVLHSLIEKVSEFGREVLDEMAFKQNSLIGLEAMTGERDAAIEIFESVESFAAKTGNNIETLMQQTKNLMSAGYGTEEIEVLRQLIGDMAIIDPGKADAISEVLSNMGRAGVMSARDLMGLKRAGLDVNEVMDNLGEAFGGSREQVKQWLAQGAIPAKDALLSVVKAQQAVYGRGGGGVGALVEKQAKTLPGAIARIKMVPDLLMDALVGFDSGAGKGVFERALTNIANVFSPGSESGERVIGKVRELVDSIAETLGFGGGFLEQLAGPDGMQKVEEAIGKVITWLKDDAVPAVKDIATAIKDIAGAIGWLHEKFSNIAGAGRALFTGGALTEDTAGKVSELMPVFQASAGRPMSQEELSSRTWWEALLGLRHTSDASGGSGTEWTPPPAGSSRASSRTTSLVFAPSLTFGDAESSKAHREAGEWRDQLADAWEQMQLQSGGAPAGGG